MTSPDASQHVLDLSGLDRSHQVGLALSGGGFRASLFHIGVLARLAEMDILKNVSVLSTVSGGSIIGAYYYLKIKELLEGHRKDLTEQYGRICRECYIAVVREIETEFLTGVQSNLRVRLFADPASNSKMLINDEYSRSDRMGDLYDAYFYQKFVKGPTQKCIFLEDIKIIPEGEAGKGFDPVDYNKNAEFKIPLLTINATSLNTGNSWHFTSSWIGESLPARNIHTNTVLKFIRFDRSCRPEPQYALQGSERQEELRSRKLKQIRLADAVAASACVPGVFKPMAIHDLYWNSHGEDIVVQLVDGGVYDNQGIDALVKAKCDYLICSDGSGQIEDELDPETSLYPVVNRSNSILMKRVREETIESLLTGQCSARGWALLHLRQCCRGDIAYPAVPGPSDISDAEKKTGHVYRLSNLRTDLDTFSDIEANTLIYHGYMLAAESFAVKGGAMRHDWGFLSIAPLLANQPGWVFDNLKIGSKVGFKLLSFSPILRALVIALSVFVFVMAILHYSSLIVAVEYLVVYLALPAILLALAGEGLRYVARRFKNTAIVRSIQESISLYRRRDDSVLALSLSWISRPLVFLTNIYLRWMDPIFKWVGSI